jgi:hypothetical protein
MRSFGGRDRWFVVVLAAFVACSGGGGKPSTKDAALDQAAAPLSCQDIRICVTQCTDTTCLAACVARGTTEGQTAFNDLQTCLATLDTRPTPTAPCSGVVPSCYCPEECYADGYCLDQVAACLAASPGTLSDMVCSGVCAP